MEEDTDNLGTINDESYIEPQTGEPMDGRESIVENIFNTKHRTEMLRRRWRGDILINGEWVHNEDKELASDKFINKNWRK